MKGFATYSVFFFLMLGFIPTIFSQNIDSLKKVLPGLSGTTKVQALIDIGYALSTSDPKEGIVYGVRGMTLARTMNDPLLLSSAYNDLSLSYFYKGDFDSTIILAELAFKIRKENEKWRNAGASISKAAMAYYEKGDYDRSLEKYLEALDYLKKDNALLETAKMQANIAGIYERNGGLEEAKEMYLESAETCLKFKDQEGYVIAKSNYAAVLQKQGNVKEAIEIQTALIPICEKHCRPEFLSEVYQALGVCERRLKHTKEGLKWYIKAKEIYDKIGAMDGMSVININIGNCYADLGQIKPAEESLLLGLKQAREIKSLLWQRDAYRALSGLETDKGNYKLANEYLLNYQQLNDSIYNEETQNKLSKLQTQYNIQQKENTILSQKNLITEKELQISQRNGSVILLISALVVMIFVGLFLFQRTNIKRKKEAIEFQNKLQKERARIAKDLHDNMGAELTIINSAIDVMTFSQDKTQGKEELETISDQVRKASALMRDTIWTVSEEKISMQQFGIKVKEFADRTFKARNVNVHFQNTDSESNLHPESTLHLFRIVQEVINNAAKHSEASNFYIDNFSADPLTIVLNDDGKGYDLNAIQKGYGLNNIESRAKEIGAVIVTESGQGVPTKVSIRISPVSVWA